MKITSRFNLEKITIDEFTLIDTGTLICHKDELIFHFQGFSIKMEFLTDNTKSPGGEFELDTKTIQATLKCYNFNNALGSSTTAPFEIAQYTYNNGVTTAQQPQTQEVLYIAFAITAHGATKVIDYNFYTKPRTITK